ncbi:MAG: terpene cyclase/mutase family protein [Planctomycetota bacterium]|jgi:hypothetical protein|nr:terpene cyclase/mutase family protein [Planctomycetota bacterium]MDP6519997.1 terpene cyclase/mutase family protein [Planctomycetota bacterium]
MRFRLLGLFLLGPLLLHGSPALANGHWDRGADKGPGNGSVQSGPAAEGGESAASFPRAAADAALARGLAFLASQQALEQDGSFPAGRGEQAAPVGVSALGALAYMASGSAPGRGPNGPQLALAIDYLLSRTAPADHPTHPGYIADEGDPASRTHGHGLATLALAQAWSMSPRSVRGQRIETALALATRRIEVSQGLEGGWAYSPVKGLEHEGSVTICLVQALRAARNVGVRVDPTVIARAVAYVGELQNDDGGFRYTLGHETVTVALTSAGISTLQAAGLYDSIEVRKAYGFLWRGLAAREVAVERGGQAEQARFPYYERFYLSQALWQNPDHSVFEEWNLRETARVISSQRRDGSWGGSPYGASYATAMNCLFLALPAGLLPIFQR